jgi:hypothetical protein
MRLKFYAQENDSTFKALTPTIIYQPEDGEFFGSVSINFGKWEAGVVWDHGNSPAF